MSKYQIFCKVIETGSFTQAAKELQFTQSAISHSIKSLEEELNTVLLERTHSGIKLTSDGKIYFPYIQELAGSEEKLERKMNEITGLENSTIRLGTYTSISRSVLPQPMKKFRELYPSVKFILYQSDYDTINKWITENKIDLGFINTALIKVPHYKLVQTDELVAVVPKDHPFAQETLLSVSAFQDMPFILMSEGKRSVILDFFEKFSVSPDILYTVYDDYSIIEMVRQGLGISILSSLVVQGFENWVKIIPIQNAPKRTNSLTWKNWDTLPYAARKFVEFLLKEK